MKLKYIILGSGFIGSRFAKELSIRNESYVMLSRSTVDYSVKQNLVSVLKQMHPEFVINAAGYTGKPNVDACEKDKANCLFGNAVLPNIIKEACEECNIPWGHVSSGCIFTGNSQDGLGLTEEDAPNFSFRQNNCSYYSGTKALGEEILMDAQDCYIWRLRIPFDNQDNPRNYLTKIMKYDRLLDAENSISHVSDFISACLQCWEKKIPYGIYNVTNPGSVTTRQIVQAILDHGLSDKEFRFFESEEEFMQKAAITPRSNCVLNTQKLISAGVTMRPVEEAINDSLTNWNKGDSNNEHTSNRGIRVHRKQLRQKLAA